MISQIHVLSAAHCFKDPSNLSQYNILIDRHELDNRYVSDPVRPAHISNHPDYKMVCNETEIPEFDFSIVHFKPGFVKSFPLNKNLIPACLPDDSMGGDFLEGKDLTVSGWGEPYYDSLHKATIPGASIEI